MWTFHDAEHSMIGAQLGTLSNPLADFNPDMGLEDEPADQSSQPLPGSSRLGPQLSRTTQNA